MLIGLVVASGMLLGSLLTLFVAPNIYALMSKKKEPVNIIANES